MYVKEVYNIVPPTTSRGKAQHSGDAAIVQREDTVMRPYLNLAVEHSRQDQMSYPGFVFTTQNRSTAVKGKPTIHPAFYTLFELDAILPTLGRLKIDLYDAKVRPSNPSNFIGVCDACVYVAI